MSKIVLRSSSIRVLIAVALSPFVWGLISFAIGWLLTIFDGDLRDGSKLFIATTYVGLVAGPGWIPFALALRWYGFDAPWQHLLGGLIYGLATGVVVALSWTMPFAFPCAIGAAFGPVAAVIVWAILCWRLTANRLPS